MNGVERHRCAVVTGASAGLGAEFARQLAPRCDALVLVARREERMIKLAEELRGRAPELSIKVIVADLTVSSERDRVVLEIGNEGLPVDLLVNNAGMGDYGEFAGAEWSRLEAMLRLNVEALTHLTHGLLPVMKRAGRGAVLNVSSLASLLPIPDFAVYAASKAYVTSFSEALRIELKDHGIRVTALCPGPVHTEFGKVAMGRDASNKFPGREFFYTEADQVVAEALAGLEEGRARVVPGWQVAAAAVVISVLPIALMRVIMGTRPRR